MIVEQYMTKIPKHNPRRNKQCVGDFLFDVNGQIVEMLKESTHSDETKAAQYAIMNSIFFEITRWCGCTFCKNRANSLIALLQKHQGQEFETEVKNKKVEETAEA